MPTRLIPVHEYHLSLSKDDVKIVFHNAEGDSMMLEYNGRRFTGRAIYREQTVLGLVASVALETIPDLQTTFLSLIVPQGHRTVSEKSIPVRTTALFSVARTSIGGPSLVKGQLQTYKTVQLEGEAS